MRPCSRKLDRPVKSADLHSRTVSAPADVYEPGSLLASLDPGAARTLHALGTRRHLRKGATLFVEGDASDRVFVLLRGRGKIFTTDREGREAVLAIRGAGDLLGELSAIDGHARSA